MKNIFLLLISIWRTIKGISHRIEWLKSHYLQFLLSLFSAYIVFSLFSISGNELREQLTSIQNYGYLTESIAVLVIAFSLVKGWKLLRTDIVFEKQDNINELPKNIDTYKKISTFDNHSIVYDDLVNRNLESGSNPIRLNNEIFELHPLVNEMLPFFILNMPEAKIDTTDDLKVRLNSDIDNQFITSNLEVNLQKTSYFRDRLSNSLANYIVMKDGRVIFDLRPHEVLTQEGYFYSLRESRLSNQLGGSVILFTSDSSVVLLKQGNRTSENSGKLAPSGSGSFDYLTKKSIEKQTFQEFSKQQIIRELTEECGLESADIHDIQICGFGRYLYRNGKPEIFCVASTKKSSSEISISVKELDFHQKEIEILSFEVGLSKENVISGLEKLISKIENKENGFSNCSGVLYWNVLFAKKYIETLDDERLQKLFTF